MHRVVREQSRAYIEGVRQVTWDTGEMCEFAACLVSAMDVLGAPVDYHRVMGLSGAAFRLTLHPDPWEPGSFSITSVVQDPYEPIRRVIEAIGRSFEIRAMSSEERDRACVMASIDQGVPVLAFGVVGPSDVSLITGYDEDAAVLLGWSTYQNIPDDHDVPPDITGYFRKPDWHANTRGYVVIGQPKHMQTADDVNAGALRFASRLVRQQAVRGMPAGLRAYEAWADAMLDDSRFTVGERGDLGGPYLGILCIEMMLDDRKSAAPFLRGIADAEPDLAADLIAAASCYDRTCALREDLRELLPEDFTDTAMVRLADPEMRRRFAGIVLGMRASDEDAIGHIEAALARLP